MERRPPRSAASRTRTGSAARKPASRASASRAPAPARKSPVAKPSGRAGAKRSSNRVDPRSPGRPAAGSGLRTELLDAAIACFTRTGIAATPLRAVATTACVTPALVHYYFGDKATLVQALVEERLLPALAPLRQRMAGVGDDPAALIAAFAHGVADAVAASPWLPALWVREVLCEGGGLREILFDRLVPEMPQTMAARFAAAQAAGRLNPDLDPRLLVVSLIGLTLFPAAGAPIWRRLFDAGDLDGDALARHAIALLDRGVGAD
ncbi:MAG: TetR/AcrR family transcriptional regulator [Lysobacteraceae bacterium]|nr:MAG: TetR/AcrR family transcriptional regulator [Xanthomonadaceae bacterium]